MNQDCLLLLVEFSSEQFIITVFLGSLVILEVTSSDCLILFSCILHTSIRP